MSPLLHRRAIQVLASFPLLVGGVALAAAPTGSLDLADGSRISGWASDADHDGPIAVHVYIDGALVKALTADRYREDVGSHAFDWTHEPFGDGEHEVVVYAIGVDSRGALDGVNPALDNTPASFDTDCDGLTGDPLAWCDGNPTYWEERQADTVYVGNDHVRAGVNPSYGGTIFQLFDEDWTENLLMEHGGAAIQLSIWGYDEVGDDAWFGASFCDATPYGSEASCLAAGHGSCTLRAWGDGDHVADCDSVEPCVGWTAGAPWNPIQAQGSSCAWANSGNDCDTADWRGEAYRTILSAPRHFTKSGRGVADMDLETVTEAGDFWIRVDHTLRYDGSRTWSAHDQEIPALFTAQGVDARFYWYEGDAPFAGTDSAVASESAPVRGVLTLPGRDPVSSMTEYGQADEFWWSACDSDDDRCVTVATFEDDVNHASLQGEAGDGAYLTPMGRFQVEPGLEETWTTYLFPYRYDHEIDGRSVREVIVELAAEAGCTAEIECNGVDEDCDGDDHCPSSGGDGGGSDSGGDSGSGDDGGLDSGSDSGSGDDGGLDSGSDSGEDSGRGDDGGLDSGSGDDGGGTDGGGDEPAGDDSGAAGDGGAPGDGNGPWADGGPSVRESSCACAGGAAGPAAGLLLPVLLVVRRRR